MAGPLQQAGAVSEPSEYATLAMDRHLTGLWTQRSLLRDADVPYLYGKFYGASRYDSLCDGLNREITARLTSARRPGSSVWNSNLFQPISFYSWKYIQNQIEILKVLEDDQDGHVYDATSGGKTALFAKASGAGKARFLGINTQLLVTDGKEVETILAASTTWQADTAVTPGTLITSGNEPGNLQMALGGITMQIANISNLSPNGYAVQVEPSSIPDNFANLIGASVNFSGLTIYTSLNGTTQTITNILSSTLGIFAIGSAPHVVSGWNAETGQCTTGSGTTGSTAPSFSSAQYGITADAGQQWKCYGSAAFPAGLAAPSGSLTITPLNGARFWRPNATLSFNYAILDENGDIQAARNYISGAGGVYKTGQSYPKWSKGAPAGQFDTTIDGTIIWWNLGAPGNWYEGLTYYTDPNQGVACILDSNQNLQWVSNGSGGAAGGTQPTWATTIGATTTDGALTWTCLGPGVLLAGSDASYAFSYHGIDGTVSTASTPFIIQSAILGQASPNQQPLPYLSIACSISITSQIDQLWIWRTASGQSTLVLEDQIGSDSYSTALAYREYGIPDTSTNGNGSLNALIPAPVASSANPPSANMTAPVYAFERVWAILNNTVVYSAGPDAVTGNGNTQFPPLNFIAYPEQPIRLIPFTTNNGGILVMTTANIYVILGTGTTSNPFYTTLYMPNVGILNWDAVDIIGSTIYAFTSKSKFVSIDPSAGYIECGFPIGDQFTYCNQGVGVSDGVETIGGGAIYSPSTAHVTWHEQGSGDTAIYVSDGEWGWFRYSPVATPESGYVWSPRATIVGKLAFAQSVETSPGINTLLLAPYGAGPILFRDPTVNSDYVYNAVGTKTLPYPAYQTIGNIIICQTGEIAEIAHIALKSIAVGTRPTVSILLGEIAASEQVPFDVLEITANDPPDLPPSQSLYSDRYTAMQNGVCPLCDNLQLKVDYGMQTVADELLMHSIYGAHHAERKQQ